jgi:probable HAF family extracellular repeat protein
MRAITSLVVALSWILFPTAWAARPLPRFAVTEIPSIGADFEMSATAINDRGEVVGIASTLPNLPYQGGPFAFFYQHTSGAVHELTFDSEQGSYAFSINDRGIIAGYAETPDLPQAVLWSRIGGAEGLGALTIAMAVNNDGTVAGNQDCDVLDCAVVWSGPNHVLTALPLLPYPPPPPYCLGQSSSNALAINNRGHIVGWAEVAGGCGGGAVEWQDGQIALLVPDAANGASVATGLNDRDEVVGVSGDHAFLYRRGALSDLGTLQGDASSSANAINEDGEIVGVSVAVDGVTSRAFIYVNGQMYDLDALLDRAGPIAGSVKLEEAVAINSHGWVAANGMRDGRPYAYLLKRVR